MPQSSFSAVYMRNPGKAAQQLAAKRKRIAELEAGTKPRSFETIDEHRKTADRLVQAFRDTGRCQDCGKELTDPTSVRRGIGPDCWSRRKAPSAGLTDLAIPFDDDELF